MATTTIPNLQTPSVTDTTKPIVSFAAPSPIEKPKAAANYFADAGTRTPGQNELVQNQLTGIIASNSPLMKQAETKSLQQANQRGLANTSMAVEAGQNAVFNYAMPIAQADASTYKSAADQQFGANFDASKFNAQNQGQTDQFNIANEMKSSEFNADNATKTEMFNAENANKLVFAQLDRDTRIELGGIEAKYKLDMQKDQTGGQLYTQAIKNISDIQRDDTLDAANKQAAIQDQVNMLKSGLESFAAITNLNLDSLLNFETSSAAVDSQSASQIAALQQQIATLQAQQAAAQQAAAAAPPVYDSGGL